MELWKATVVGTGPLLSPNSEIMGIWRLLGQFWPVVFCGIKIKEVKRLGADDTTVDHN